MKIRLTLVIGSVLLALLLLGGIVVAAGGGTLGSADAQFLAKVEEDNVGYRIGAAELYVCPSGCTYSSVQAAVDAADPGDIIKGAQGTYTDLHVRAGITQVVYISKTVTVQGGYTAANWDTPDRAAHPTTWDAQGHGRVFYLTGNITPTI